MICVFRFSKFEYYQTVHTCYIFGGIGTHENGDEFVNCGKMINGSWHNLKSSRPVHRHGFALTCIGDYAHISDGSCYTREKTYLSYKIGHYHIPTSTWSWELQLPVKRMNHGCVTFGNNLYCMGGSDADDVCNTMFRYDFKSESESELESKSGKWTIRKPMKYDRLLSAYIVITGYIYVFGGCGIKKNVNCII